MSYGEAELYAATKAAEELMGVRGLMQDIGWPVHEAHGVREVGRRRCEGRTR